MKNSHRLYLRNLFFYFVLSGSLIAFEAYGNSVEAGVGNFKPICGFGSFRIDSDFEMGRISQCQQTGKNEYSLTVLPEGVPINTSAWYAFRLLSEQPKTVTLYLHYGTHKHRYSPKVSTDGKIWSRLEKRAYQVILDGKALKLKLKASKKPLYIAAQEVIDNNYYKQWTTQVAKHESVVKNTLGQSKEGRSLPELVVRGEGNQWIVILGRQHPPEVTGALALFPFVETLLSNSELSKQFLQHYNLLIVPNLNPDGVAHGHWRFNSNGVDINRDWGVFKQPEVKQVMDRILQLTTADNQRWVLGLDFHSTKEDVFYTQKDDTLGNWPNFTRDWLQQLQNLEPSYKVYRKATHNPGLPTFKTYISEAYDIPSITYELGDETNRETIKRVSSSAATALMQELLKKL